MKKFIAMALALLMMVSVPMSVLATEIDLNIGVGGCDYYNVIEKNDYNLAPGAVESEIIINDDTGNNRNVVHVIEIDPNNDNVYAMPSFKNISEDVDYTDTSNWGPMIMSEHAAHAENELGLNVIGAMNVCLSWDFDHPYGLLVYNGKVLCDNRATCTKCGKGHPGGGYLVIYKDGKAELRDANAELTGDEWMAQTVCFAFLVRNGKNLATGEDHTDTNRAPRSVIGVKEDGTLVLMMNDGRMSPYSAGFTTHEMAEMMLDLGCVDAINCDGGGSSTFITEREGTGELTVKSRFSDGAARETLTGILVVSKATADGKFTHAAIETEDKFVTPGSTVEFTATGADAAGGPAEIPADVSWQLADPSMGSVENGVFTSNGTLGTAVVQMVYNGAVVGEDSVEVVYPTSVSFTKANYTVPFSKTVAFEVKATINEGLNEVVLKDGDYTLTLSDNTLGTFDGNKFTAHDGSLEAVSGTVTVTINGTEVSATSNVVLGKGSEIIEDFESGETECYVAPQYDVGEKGYVEIVTAETGKVRNGNYAMALTLDANAYTYYTGRVGWKLYGVEKLLPPAEELAKASSIGMWMYIPEDCLSMWARFCTYNTAGASRNYNFLNVGQTYAMEREGWYYLSVDLEATKELRYLQFYIEDYVDGEAYGYVAGDHKNQGTMNTFYIDDITIDYSDAVDDREVPEFEDVYVSYGNMDAVVMKGQTVDSNDIAVTVQAKDFAAENAVGLDAASATAFVDGIEVKANVSCTTNGLITVSGLNLKDGYHSFRIEISDTNGNTGHVTRYLTIDASEEVASISVEAQDPEVEYMPSGSIYWVDVKATDIANFKSVTTTIDLNGAHNWELDHLEAADGYEVTYSVNKFHTAATLTITKTEDAAEAEGEFVLASLPIRIWQLQENDPNNDNAQWTRQVVLGTTYGQVTYADDSQASFSMVPMVVETEHYVSANFASEEELEALPRWHQHIKEAVADKAATCTEDGYTGRTICVGCACERNTEETPCAHAQGCGSIVDWGTTLEATGHTYTFTDGVLKCACGELFNGEYTDGKIYADGVVANGWMGESYYVDGAMLTGVNKVMAPDESGEFYYNFGEDGVCKNQTKFTGMFYDSTVNGNRYAYLGSLDASWQMIGGSWYYFRHDTYTAATGEYNYYGIIYTFDDQGKLIKGAWVESEEGIRYYQYSNNYYHFCWAEIDGNTYYFNSSGYRVSGFTQVRETFTEDYKWYEFTEDGVLVGILNGIVNADGTNRYYVDGVRTAAGLFELDGAYYYARTNGVIATGSYYVNKYSTEELAAKFPAGTYHFAEDGKMIIDEEEEPVVEKVEGVVATPSDIDVTISWDVFEGATGYYVRVRDAENTKTLKTIHVTSGTSAKFTTEVLEYNTEYVFQVIAYVGDAYQKYADADNVVSGMVIGNRVVGLSATIQGKGAIISFLPVENATEYYAYVYDAETMQRHSAVSVGNATSVSIINDLYAGKKYIVKIIPRINGVWATDIENALGVEFTAPVVNPTTYTVADQTATSVRINWSAVRGVEEYFIRVREKATGNIVNTLHTTGGKTTATISRYTDGTKLSPNTTYTVEICAYISGMELSYSEPMDLTTKGFEDVAITATLNAEGKVDLNWNATEKAAAYYLYRIVDGKKTYFRYLEGAENTSLTVKAPAAAGEYTYGVIVVENSTAGKAYVPMAVSNAISIA